MAEARARAEAEGEAMDSHSLQWPWPPMAMGSHCLGLPWPPMAMGGPGSDRIEISPIWYRGDPYRRDPYRRDPYRRDPYSTPSHSPTFTLCGWAATEKVLLWCLPDLLNTFLLVFICGVLRWHVAHAQGATVAFIGKGAFSTLVAGCGPRPQHWHVGESGFDPLRCYMPTRKPSFS